MFSTVISADYADVFLSTSPNPSLTAVGYTLVAVGLITLFWTLLFAESDALMVAALGLMMGAFIVIVPMQIISSQLRNTVADNMVSNVEAKYGAHLELSEDRDAKVIGNLDKPRKYMLVFPNGAAAEYTMHFTESSEPMIADEPQAPTVQQLNER